MAGLGWVLKFKAVKEHQQALHVIWWEEPAAEEVILQCWGVFESHFSLRWNFVFVSPESDRGNLEQTFAVPLTPCTTFSELVYPAC